MNQSSRAPSSALRFYQPDGEDRVLLPYCIGAPHGPEPDRPFFEESEKVLVDRDLQDLYKRQPAWFHPRRIWPEHPRKEVPFEAKTTAEIKSAYAGIPRPPDIAEDEWDLHVKHVHGFLITSNKEEWADADGLHAMLRIVIRGLDQIIAIGHFEMKIDVPEQEDKASEMLLPDGFGGLTPAISTFKAHTQGKRLYANFVHMNEHWTSIIWDKRYGQLYYFDSLEQGRASRIKMIRLAWKRFLREAGYPEPFDLCVVPYTKQPSSNECGYLALFGLLTTLRGLVGCQIAGHTSNWQNGMKVSFNCSELTTPFHQPFDLRIRDWCLYTPEKSSIKQYMRDVYSTLEAIAGNELGIACSGKQCPGLQYRHRWSLKNLTGLLEKNGQWKNPPSNEDNHTWLGGWSPLVRDSTLNPLYPRGMRVFQLEDSSDQKAPMELHELRKSLPAISPEAVSMTRPRQDLPTELQPTGLPADPEATSKAKGTQARYSQQYKGWVKTTEQGSFFRPDRPDPSYLASTRHQSPTWGLSDRLALATNINLFKNQSQSASKTMQSSPRRDSDEDRPHKTTRVRLSPVDDQGVFEDLIQRRGAMIEECGGFLDNETSIPENPFLQYADPTQAEHIVRSIEQAGTFPGSRAESEESEKIYENPKARRQDRAFQQWKDRNTVISTGIVTPTGATNRSGNRDTITEASSDEDPSSTWEDPYRRLVRSPTTEILEERPVPILFRVSGAYEKRDEYEGLADQRNLSRLGAAGDEMTRQVARKHLDNVSRNVVYSSYSESYCSLMPPGLMDERVWDRARSEAEQAANPPRTGSTRAERAAARDARRG